MEKTIKIQKIKRLKKHGFRARTKAHGGRKVLKRRRQKNRVRVAISR